MSGVKPQGRRVRACALQTSAMVLAMVVGGQAFAQCAPDPTQPNATTTCTGTDTDGLRVTTANTRVEVASTAMVLGSTGPAIAIQTPGANSSYTTVTVAGGVNGNTQAGIRLLTDASSQNYASSQLALTVQAGGTIAGINGVVIGQGANGFSRADATIDNAGTITGTSGIALLASTPGYSGFTSITNRAGGFIGAISGGVGRLNNAGTIDGGTRSAIDWGTASGWYADSITNSGTITANTTAATLANAPSYSLINSGNIVNRGAGAVIDGANLSITNQANGRISTAGPVAIRAANGLTLTNSGTIDGSIAVGAATGFFYSTSRVDSTAGTINGNVTFGAGNDTLVARYSETGLVTGITGAINGGAGTDSVQVTFTADANLRSAIVLPTAFEQSILAPNQGVTATLADGFTTSGALRLAGAGTIVNRTTLANLTIATEFGSSGSPTFINAGTITTAGSTTGSYGLNVGSLNRFENNGTITAAGNGISSSSVGRFVNTGTITANDTAVYLFGSSFDNSGTIRSTAGIGAILNGSSGSNWTNSGRIEGAVAGARVSSILTNTGTITSPGTGVMLDWYGGVDNRAGGVISGGTTAIGPQSASSGLLATTVVNAGTINGNVALTNSFADSYNANRFFALSGGVLNGNLTLSQGGVLVTELVNTGTGAFAGINGTVSGTGALLRYRVRRDASATIATPASFAGVGYDLFDNAVLTLTGSPSTQSLTLAGKGTVDLTADITAATAPAISAGSVMVAPGESYASNALVITSRGALALTRGNTSIYPYSAVAIGSADRFTNAGSITVRDQSGQGYSQISAIAGGQEVTNAGTITLDGAIGVQGAQRVVNTGSITQIAGGRAATGIRASYTSTTLVNSGTIDVAGSAVLGDYSLTVENSGRIASALQPAIALTSYGSATITNRAGGTITSAAGTTIRLSGGWLSNAGTIGGAVDFSYNPYGRSSLSSTYIADGGTVTGDLRFGDGNDQFVSVDGHTGISGTINGGEGTDIFVHALTKSGAIGLGALGTINFETEEVRALGVDTVATVTAAAPVTSDLYVSGDGAIINRATIEGAVLAGQDLYNAPASSYAARNRMLASFTNEGDIRGGVFANMRRLVNTGTIGTATLDRAAVAMWGQGDLAFNNTGQILAAGNAVTLSQSGAGTITIENGGTINGAVLAGAGDYWFGSDPLPSGSTVSITAANTGTISAGNAPTALRLNLRATEGTIGTITLNNSGTIDAGAAGATAASLSAYSYGDTTPAATITVANSGTLRANGGGTEQSYTEWWSGNEIRYTVPASALLLAGNGATATITNAASGVIEATGPISTAIFAQGTTLDLTNAGTIRGGAGTVLVADSQLAAALGTPYLAGAIQTIGDTNDRVVNTGTIIGSVALGMGNDRIENHGRIEGNVFLGLGDDTFLQRASAVLIGTVDGGEGNDHFIVDATGGGAVNGDQFINFERFSQIGEGNVTYSGNFRFDTIGVSGGTVTVAAGQTLSSAGAVTVTGSDAAETLVNNGTIAGAVALAGGNDRVVNMGTILGPVSLGDGNDAFVEGVNSRVAGIVDGGAGTDLYTVQLGGDRSGIGQRSGFEQLAVEGRGTLSLTLDQRFEAVSLAGTGLNVALNGYTIGSVLGSDGADSFSTDGDVARVALGAGSDLLSLGATRLAGLYNGGEGTDTLRFTATGPVMLTGTATGFEQVALAGNALTIAGTLGTVGASLAFGAGDQQISVAPTGTLAGVIDLGAGNDALRLAAGATLNGTVSGGAGTDIATLELAGDRTLASATLRDFETLATEGRGILTLTGAHGYDQVLAGTDLAIAGDASLTATQVRFGGGDNRMLIAGRFAGAVDGGAGRDSITISGGSATAPVAFTSIAGVEAFGMTGGYATIAGTAALGGIDLTGGRLVGLAGSTITAPRIAVGRGATFGSAGTVNGDIAVAGTLSPGASPGVMTVNGNVTLAGTSTSLFEITPTLADKLVVNGAVAIGQGATLQITATGAIRPGTSYDLVVASGGITGSYTNVLKPDTVFGFVVQRADRIQLLGQFLGDARFSPQVSRSIAYANATLIAQPATSTLFAALPSLLTASGASNPRAFAQLTPEPYANATQLALDHALTLTQAARSPAFATLREEAGLFTFGQTVGQWHTLRGDAAQGSATARTQSYGFLGGLGYGDREWSVGAFAGYLNGRQQIGALGARTQADGIVAGVHGRYGADAGWGFSASLLYDGGEAYTDRALPGAGGATARYNLHSWVGDLAAYYGLEVGNGWSLRPRVGITYIRTTRDGFTETGGSAFALTVARDRHVAGFADAGVTFARSEASDAPFRPFVTLGTRYQIEGQRADALAGYAGGGLGLTAVGASRTEIVGTAAGGVAYRLPSGLDIFATAAAQTGRDDHQETISAGVRLRF